MSMPMYRPMRDDLELKWPSGRKLLRSPWLIMIRKSVGDKKVLNHRLSGWKKLFKCRRKRPSKRKKKCIFVGWKMASHACPQRLLHVTVGFQCARETSPRCGGATVPPCNHSGCPTTPSKAILKHMTTPYGTLYQISNFPREQNTIILNRPRWSNTSSSLLCVRWNF